MEHLLESPSTSRRRSAPASRSLSSDSLYTSLIEMGFQPTDIRSAMQHYIQANPPPSPVPPPLEIPTLAAHPLASPSPASATRPASHLSRSIHSPLTTHRPTLPNEAPPPSPSRTDALNNRTPAAGTPTTLPPCNLSTSPAKSHFSLADTDSSAGDADASDICKLCYQRRAKVAYSPCGHLGACAACTKRLDDPACPFCRVPINGVLRVYKV